MDYHQQTDKELLTLLAADDARALTELHDRYYPVLYAHAYKRLADREEVKDLLQELFLLLWNKRGELHFTGHFAGYLYAAVRNKILNIYKHRKVRSDYIDSFQEFLIAAEPIADERLREKELAALIEKSVAALPPQMRLIFEMSRNHYLSHQEIATQLNISPLTVKKQVSNSLKILRTKLGAYFYILFL